MMTSIVVLHLVIAIWRIKNVPAPWECTTMFMVSHYLQEDALYCL